MRAAWPLAEPGLRTSAEPEVGRSSGCGQRGFREARRARARSERDPTLARLRANAKLVAETVELPPVRAVGETRASRSGADAASARA